MLDDSSKSLPDADNSNITNRILRYFNQINNAKRVTVSYQELEVIFARLSDVYTIKNYDKSFQDAAASFFETVGLSYVNRSFKPLVNGVIRPAEPESEALGFDLSEQESEDHVEKAAELEEAMEADISRIRKQTVRFEKDPLGFNKEIMLSESEESEYYSSINSTLLSNWEEFYGTKARQMFSRIFKRYLVSLNIARRNESGLSPMAQFFGYLRIQSYQLSQDETSDPELLDAFVRLMVILQKKYLD